MKIKALVAVRSGSMRVQNKNIRPFAGSSLLEIKLEQLKRISGLDGIVVNSNDDTMLEIALKMGCEVVKREQYYASNEVSMSDVYKNMAENMDADIIAYINVTNPLLNDESLEEAIRIFKEGYREGKFDSLNSAHLVKEFLFEDNKPINYDLRNQPRSQDLPDIAALNFAINIISKETMINCKNVVGEKPYIHIIDEIEATDIDNPIDFEFAEYVYKKNKHINEARIEFNASDEMNHALATIEQYKAKEIELNKMISELNKIVFHYNESFFKNIQIEDNKVLLDNNYFEYE